MIKYSQREQSESVKQAVKLSRKRNRFGPFRWHSRIKAIKQKSQLTSIWRLGTQGFFVLLSLLMGWQFLGFVEAAQDPQMTELPFRPPGIEGYLPISGLMGALDWIYQGTLNTVHPAATVLFLLFMFLSFLFRKSFCAWICPVGFLSESLARLGRWMFGSNLKPPKWLDIILRSVKYLLLGFFVWAIFSMSAGALSAFINSPYNKVSDIKMLYFFLDLSTTGLIIIGILAILSILIEGFWCRYLCPYGALLGLFSWMSPTKVRRNPDTCTDCAICDKVCPARIQIMTKKNISSVECIGCTDCVTSCPVPGALNFGTKKHNLSPRTIALTITVVLILTTTAARYFGIWQNDLSDAEVKHHVEKMDGPGYGHPGMNE